MSKVSEFLMDRVDDAAIYLADLLDKTGYAVLLGLSNAYQESKRAVMHMRGFESTRMGWEFDPEIAYPYYAFYKKK